MAGKKDVLKSDLIAKSNLQQLDEISASSFLNIHQARNRLQMSKSTLLKLCRNHEIAYYPGIGGKFLFKEADLIEYSERFRVERRKSA